MAAAFPNIYHKRLVAPTAAKSCYICNKPVSTVLVTPDNKDYFYACPGHLTDRGFATPTEGEDEASKAEKARKEALEKEIEVLKKEFEEKQKKKKAKKKSKDNKDKDKEKDDDEEKQKDQKIAELEKQKEGEGKLSDGPRIFNLNKTVYQSRLNRLRAAKEAQRMKSIVNDPMSFPSVPKGDL